MHNIKQQMGFLDACHHHIFVIKILSHQRNLRLGYHILYIYIYIYDGSSITFIHGERNVIGKHH